jgi:transcriptional regulator with XRE-family HTH domain
MNNTARNSLLPSTTTAGLASQFRGPVIVGLSLVGFGTSVLLGVPSEFLSYLLTEKQTTAGKSISRETVGSALAELRRLTGFTWDQLARLFNVSRRSLHFWASGKAMTPGNEEHLQRMLSVLKRIDRGSASANRAALLSPNANGEIPCDQLASGRYDFVVAALGQWHETPRVFAPLVSDGAKLARTPRPPEDLVGALHNRVHHKTGQSRAARSVRTRSGGR